MTAKELEPATALDIPEISKKTQIEQLRTWSSQKWPSDGSRGVAADIVKNGKELLAGSNIDWKLVLSSIHVQQVSSTQVGEAAIAANDARTIGGFAVAAGWAMHDPAIVYLSGIYLANRAGDKLEDFRTTMRQAAVAYGEKVFPKADLYMKTLDLLLELRDRSRRRNIITHVAPLLREGNIEEAYKTVSS